MIRQVKEREEIQTKKLKEKKSEEYEHLRHYQKTTTIKNRDGNVYQKFEIVTFGKRLWKWWFEWRENEKN